MSLPIDVKGLVFEFDLGPVTVERRGVPSTNRFGGIEPAPVSSISISPVTWHTLAGRDLDQVPEADRTTEVREFYTLERLYTATDGQAADVVIADGRRWRVIKANDYDRQGEVYFSLATLEDPQARP